MFLDWFLTWWVKSMMFCFQMRLSINEKFQVLSVPLSMQHLLIILKGNTLNHLWHYLQEPSNFCLCPYVCVWEPPNQPYAVFSLCRNKYSSLHRDTGLWYFKWPNTFNCIINLINHLILLTYFISYYRNKFLL